MMKRLDYLVIGHITKDLLAEGYTVGGTVAYAGLTARNLGCRVGVVTSASSDLDLGRALRGIEVVRLPSPVTTTFQNIYHGDTREQFVRATAARITAEAIPPAWRRTPIVHLGPIAQEIDEEIAGLFEGSLVGATPQGWMRHWDDDGRVRPKVWEEAEKLLPWARVIIFSEEDVGGDISLIENYAQLFEIVVVTTGWKGSTVYYGGQVRYFPAREVVEVDPTGAGDVYAAAYLIHLKETGDPWEAARFANVVASFSVEGRGIAAVPTREQIEKWFRERP